MPLVQRTSDNTLILHLMGVRVKMRISKVWCLVRWRLGVKSSVSKYKRDFESALETREQRKVEQREELD